MRGCRHPVQEHKRHHAKIGNEKTGERLVDQLSAARPLASVAFSVDIMFGGVGDLSRVERLASWGICCLVQCKLLIHLGIPHEAAGARGLCVECAEVQRPDHRGLRVRHPDGKVCCLRRSTTLAPYGQAARA